MHRTLLNGHAHHLISAISYHDQPALVYHNLCHDSKHSVLLESAEIESKTGLKSVLVVDAALSIRCDFRQVQLQALTENGANLLPFLIEQLSEFEPQRQGDLVTVLLPPPSAGLDEDSRLLAPSPLSVLRLLIQQLHSDSRPEALLLAGCFAFDLVAAVEPLPVVMEGANCCPDYLFYLAETTVVLDHQQQRAEVIGTIFGGEDPSINQLTADKGRRMAAIAAQLKQPLMPLPTTTVQRSPVHVNQSDDVYCAKVEQLKQHIQVGDIFQVVPARCFSLPCPEPLAAYQRLKALNPSPYMFYMTSPEFTLFGASPESALKYDKQSNQVEIYPIAGTRKRGKFVGGEIDHDLDSRIELGLRQDQKELAEHLMLVDLARNDIARISQPGSRKIAELLKVDRYSHVMHLVSRVTGQLRTDLDALHAYQACMNMGTLTGAPKVRAAQLLRQAEGERRGSYGGAVGYLNGRGDMDTCIIIRSAFVRHGTAYVQAGAGVVADSDPQCEADETRQKAQAVLRAINGYGEPS